SRRLHDVAERLDKNARRKELRRMLASSPLERTKADTATWDRTRDNLHKLAGKVDAAVEPVLSMLSLARVLYTFGDAALAERILRSSLARHPDEVVLLHTL